MPGDEPLPVWSNAVARVQMLLRSDNRLLLACVRARYDPAAVDEARRIVAEGDVGWDPFLSSREYMARRRSTRHPDLVPLHYPRMFLDAALQSLRATRASPRR
jgi:hypothetical protein